MRVPVGDPLRARDADDLPKNRVRLPPPEGSREAPNPDSRLAECCRRSRRACACVVSRFSAERAVWDDERIAATARLAPGASVRHEFAKGRHGWLQVARGAVDVNGVALAQGDGLAISDERSLAVTSRESAEVLLFDLA